MTLKWAEILSAKYAWLASFTVFVLVCIYLSTLNDTLWFDEAYTLAMIETSWIDILSFTANDFHPPLYYYIIKAGSSILGNDIFAIRLLSILPIILTLLLVYFSLTKNLSIYAAILFTLAFLASNRVILYALEIRMYSWALLFVTATFISSYMALKSDNSKWYLSLFVFFLLTFYTQYFAGILVGIGFIFISIYTILYNKKRITTLIAIAVASFILYLPWLFIVVKQVSVATNDFWIPNFSYIDTIKITLSIFTSGNVLTSILLLFLFGYSLLIFYLKKQKQFEDYFFFWGLLSVLAFITFGTVLSFTIRPLFISRYMTPACGIVWLFFAAQLSTKPAKVYVSIVLLFLGLHSFWELQKVPNENGYVHFNHIAQKSIKQNDVIIVAAPEVSGGLIGVIAYLFPEHIMTITNDKSVRRENRTLNYHISPFKMKIAKYKDLKNYTHLRKWLFIPYNAKNKDLKQFSKGSKTIHKGNFGWLGYITGYQFDLYEIHPHNND